MGVVICLADRISAQARKSDFIAVFIQSSESGISLDAPGLEATPDNQRMLAGILFNASQVLEEAADVSGLLNKGQWAGKEAKPKP